MLLEYFGVQNRAKPCTYRYTRRGLRANQSPERIRWKREKKKRDKNKNKIDKERIYKEETERLEYDT